jgi:hypothetical protein
MNQQQQLDLVKSVAEKTAKAVHDDIKDMPIDPAFDAAVAGDTVCTIAGGAACAASCFIPVAGAVLSAVGNSIGVAAAKAL